MASEFGKKLKELREKKGETQANLAEIIGVATRQIQRYEESTIPRPEKIKALKHHYKYDFFSLIDDVEVPHETADSEKNLSGNLVDKQILLNLSESHKNLSAAHKELAESNHQLAKNQNALISQTLSTGGEASETLEVVERKLRGLQELLIKIGTGKGKTWLSEQEARAEVHNVVYGTEEDT